jgi:hypothetical protein
MRRLASRAEVVTVDERTVGRNEFLTLRTIPEWVKSRNVSRKHGLMALSPILPENRLR